MYRCDFIGQRQPDFRGIGAKSQRGNGCQFRDAANGLEKFTWAMALVIVVLSLVATLSMDKGTVAASNKDLEKDANALIEMTQEAPVMPQAVPAEAPASEQPAADQQQ